MENQPSTVTTINADDANLTAVHNLVSALMGMGLPVMLHASGFSINGGAPRIEALMNEAQSEITLNGAWAGGGNNFGNLNATISLASLSNPGGINQVVQLITCFLGLTTPDTFSDSE